MSDLGSAQRDLSALGGELRTLQRQLRDGEVERAGLARSIDAAQERFRREHDRLRSLNRSLQQELETQAEGLAQAREQIGSLNAALEQQRRKAQEDLAALRRHFDREQEQLRRQLREMDERLSRELEELRRRQDEYFAELRRRSDQRLSSAEALCGLAGEMLAAAIGDARDLALTEILQQTRYSIASAQSLAASGEAEAALGVADGAAALGFRLERERHRRRQALIAQRASLLECCNELLEQLDGDGVVHFLNTEAEGLRRQLRQWHTRIEGGFREFQWFQAEATEAVDALRQLADLSAALSRLAQECAELEAQRRERLAQVLEALFAAFGDTAADSSDWLTNREDRKADHALRFAVAGHTLRFRLPLRGGIVLDDEHLTSAHLQVRQKLEGLLGVRAVWHVRAPEAPRPGFHDPLLAALTQPTTRR